MPFDTSVQAHHHFLACLLNQPEVVTLRRGRASCGLSQSKTMAVQCVELHHSDALTDTCSQLWPMHLAVAADNYDRSSLYVQVREAHRELQSKSEEVDDMITAAQAKDADNTRLWDQVRYADMGTPLIHDFLLHLARHCIIRCKKSTAHALICPTVQH